jgi:hypothetical protein
MISNVLFTVNRPLQFDAYLVNLVSGHRDWVTKGMRLPSSTEFRATLSMDGPSGSTACQSKHLGK